MSEGGVMAAVRIWGRGQVTIPAAFRRELDIDEQTVVEIVRVGDALVLTPRKLLGDAFARRAEREMKKAGLTLDDLLTELRGQRERYHRERYGG
jgi:AbrB family looped-hinge helix DNA binding protein